MVSIARPLFGHPALIEQRPAGVGLARASDGAVQRLHRLGGLIRIDDDEADPKVILDAMR